MLTYIKQGFTHASYLADGQIDLLVTLPPRCSSFDDFGGEDILDASRYWYTNEDSVFRKVTFDFTDVEAFCPSTLFDMVCKCDDRGITDISFINMPYRHTSYLMTLSAVFDIPVTVKVRPK